MLKDVEWFETFVISCNCILIIPSQPRQDWVIECDATLKAPGTFSPSSFYAAKFPPAVASGSLSITQLEALNLVQAVVTLLPPDPGNFKLIINTDNAASQQVLSSGRGRENVLCTCARQLWFLSANNNSELEICHRAGKDLVLADALSCSFESNIMKLKAAGLCKQLNLKEVPVTFSLSILDFNL